MKNLLNDKEKKHLKSRKITGNAWFIVFLCSISFAVVFLCLLLGTIINSAFGSAIITYKNTLGGLGISKSIDELSKEEMIAVINEQSRTDPDFTPFVLRTIEKEKPLTERSKDDLTEIFVQNILTPNVEKVYTLAQSLFNRSEIVSDFKEAKEESNNAVIIFKSWLSPEFIKKRQSSDPLLAGVRTALLGSFWVIIIVIATSLPLGILTAVYLEEYAKDTLLNRMIRINIYNLSGVPSIIYGLLGLSVFVRALSHITSGAMFFGMDNATVNGRTILSAGLTLAILVLPIIIINSQEAIRAVPQSLRESSYGVGATKLQTIWHHVLPASFDRIMTGTILAVSRAIGETAPIVVIGASTFIVFDPTSIFSKFTTLPIQIYQWTSRPQGAYKSIAAAAIITLLILLLSMNSFAILIRDYNSRKRRV